jgi:hypothetical protein
VQAVVKDIQSNLGVYDGAVTCAVGPGVMTTRVRMDSESRRGGGVRQPIIEWTKRSRLNMERSIASLDMTALMARREWGWRICMLTLTFPGDWEGLVPGASYAHRDLKNFLRRLARATGVPVLGFAKKEFQRRGAPHFHLCLALPLIIDDVDVHEWVSQNWYQVVGSGDVKHLRAGTGIDWSTGARSTDPYRVALYFLHHAAPSGNASKEYQNRPPQLWIDNSDVGRFWFVLGLRPIDAELTLTNQQYVELRRLLRAHYRSTHTRRRVTVERVNSKTGVVSTRKVHRRARLWNLKSGRLLGVTYFSSDAPALLTILSRGIGIEKADRLSVLREAMPLNGAIHEQGHPVVQEVQVPGVMAPYG